MCQTTKFSLKHQIKVMLTEIQMRPNLTFNIFPSMFKVCSPSETTPFWSCTSLQLVGKWPENEREGEREKERVCTDVHLIRSFTERRMHMNSYSTCRVVTQFHSIYVRAVLLILFRRASRHSKLFSLSTQKRMMFQQKQLTGKELPI